MKIKSLTQKTALEVEDSDVLIIEDNEETKQITVADFKEYMTSASATEIKRHINETLDRICVSLQNAKYILQENYTYLTYIWIDTSDGYIKVALKDKGIDKWLSVKEIEDLTGFNKETKEFDNGFMGIVTFNGVSVEPTSYSIESYNANYPIDAEDELSMADAGYISMYCEVSDNGKIAALTYEDIELSLEATEQYIYEFIITEENFTNTVELVEIEARMTNVGDTPIYENYAVAGNVQFINGILTVDTEPEEDTTFFADLDEESEN